jgi:glutathione-regulated potassium-efflux system ancillary protein KefC
MAYEQLIIGFAIIAAGIISLEIGISVAIVEILTGVIVRNVFEITGEAWLTLVANLGLLGIMFFAGFEIRGGMLKDNIKRGLPLGFAAFIFPFLIIFLLSNLIFKIPFRPSILIGLGLSTTSLALVYTVLKQTKTIPETYKPLLMTSVMIVDILAMLSLTILFQGFHLIHLVILIGFILLLVVIPKIGNWIFSRYHGNQIEFQTRFIFLILLGVFLISEQVGVHIAVLAFMIGIAMSGLMSEHKILEDKLSGIIFGLLSPLFFFNAGLSINLRILDIIIIQLIVIIAIVAILSKFISTYLVARLFMDNKMARLFGLIFNSRLSFAIIVATFGLQEGLINQSIYASMLVVIVISPIIVSTILKIVPKDVVT